MGLDILDAFTCRTMAVYYEFVGYGEYSVHDDLERRPYSPAAYERQTTYLLRDGPLRVSSSEVRR